MKIQRSNQPLPRQFKRHPQMQGLCFEQDVGIGSSLKLKLLVFEKPVHLRRFWKSTLGKAPLGAKCLGAVNSLGYELSKNGKSVYVVDPRYFAIMGLCKDHLGMEILTHESVHAGISYAKRTLVRNLWHDPMDFEEEKLAYPIGRIARNVLIALRRAKLLP